MADASGNQRLPRPPSLGLVEMVEARWARTARYRLDRTRHRARSHQPRANRRFVDSFSQAYAPPAGSVHPAPGRRLVNPRDRSRAEALGAGGKAATFSRFAPFARVPEESSMKACLDDNELLQVLVSDVGEYADSRAHLAGCSQCAGAYQKIAADTGIITSALTRAADRLDYRENAIARAAKSGALARFRYGVRSAVVFSGAMAFGGAAAFALMIALGWRPTTMKNEIARVSAGNPSARIASASGDTNQMASGNAKQV